MTATLPVGTVLFFKMGHSQPIFSFRLFNTVDSFHSILILPMTGFEPQASGRGKLLSDLPHRDHSIHIERE